MISFLYFPSNLCKCVVTEIKFQREQRQSRFWGNFVNAFMGGNFRSRGVLFFLNKRAIWWNKILFALNEWEKSFGWLFITDVEPVSWERRVRVVLKLRRQFASSEMPAQLSRRHLKINSEEKVEAKENKAWILRNLRRNPFWLFLRFSFLSVDAFKHHRFCCVQVNRHKMLNRRCLHGESQLGRASFARFNGLILVSTGWLDKLRFPGNFPFSE